LLWGAPHGYGRAVPRSTPIAALCVALLACVPAQAATKTVYMGVPASSQKAFARYGADVNAYFPGTITIRRGDKVRFLPVGFHSVDLPPRGQKPMALLSSTGAIAGASDANGVPFWFNGQQSLQFTPSLLQSNFGRTATYNGSRGTDSGIPLGNKLKPFTVRFTKTGTFTYYDNLHSGVKGKVRVLSPRSRVPSAKANAKTVKRDVAKALKDAKALQTVSIPQNTIQVGNASPSGVEVYSMFPSTLTVPAGTVLTFALSRYSHDLHTATTGPGDPETTGSFLGNLASSISSAGPIDQQGIYPSDPRPAPAPLNPAWHGNGFWNSGFMDTTTATTFPKSSQVRIVAPGTYTFFCLLHPFMQVTVTAT
jgi:plastocyanin